MECLRCGHKSEAAIIRCTACGTTFPRADFEELTRINTVLAEAYYWVQHGIISKETHRAIKKFYQPEQDRLEKVLGLQPPSAPAPPPPTDTQVTRHEVHPPSFPAEREPRHPTRPSRPDERVLARLPTVQPAREERTPRAIRVPAAAQSITWTRLWRSLFAEHALDLMLGLGALLFVISAAALVIRYWTQFPPTVQTLIVLAGTGLFYAGGFLVRARLRAQHSGIVITGIGALLVPLNTVTIARIFGVASAHWPLLWLLTFLAMLPLNALTARWLQTEFFAYIALVSAVGAIGSAASLAGLPFPWWGAPIVFAGVAFLLLAPRVASSFLTILHRPLVIGGTLLGLLAGPWVLWVAGEIHSYLRGGATLPHAAPVAAAWGAAAVLGMVLVAQAPRRTYAYGMAAAMAGASVFAAAATARVPWGSLGLVVVAAAGALLERRLTAAGEMVARPCRHVAWICAAVGGAWSFMSLDTAVAALSLDSASVLWWARLYRRWWLLLLGLALVAISLTAAMLRANVPLAALGAGWIGLGLLYLGMTQLTRIHAEEAAAFYFAAYGLLICAQAPAFLWPSEGFQTLALGAALGVSAWSIHLGDHDRALRALLSVLPIPWRATLFTWITVTLFPLWALRVWLWQGGTTVGAGVMLSTIALLYSPVAYRLARAVSPHALPLLSTAYLLGTIGPVLALSDRALLTVALVLDTVFLTALAVGFGSQRLAGFATAASLGAILAAPLRVPVLSSPAALTAIGLLYSIAKGQAGRIRGTGVFAEPLFWVSRVAAALAFIIASSHLADGRTLSGLAGYTALALVLVVWSLMDQEQLSAALGAVIGAAAITSSTDAGLLLRLGLHVGDHGPAWAALALVLGIAGICLGRWRRSAGGLLPLAGTGLAAAALLAAVDRPSSEWVTLLFALALFGLCAVFQLRGRLPVVDAHVGRVEWSPALAGMLRAAYVYLFTWLLPFWVYLTMSRIPALAATRENLGVGLVLLAWAYLGVSGLMKAVHPAYEAPWLVTAPPLAAAGLVIAVTERLPFVIASGAASLLCVGFALTLRTPRWLYPAALLAAPAWVLGLAHVGLSTQLLGPSLLVLAAGELALGHWLDGRAGTAPDRITATALPFWIVGFALIPPALLWASISDQPVALSAFLAGAAVYAAAGIRFKDALFSYPVTGLLGLGYLFGVSLVRDRLQFPTTQWAAWLLPGVVASMLVAWIVNHRYLHLRRGIFFARSPAAPPTALASAGALAVVILAWSQPWLRVWVTAAAAAVYMMGIGVTRGWGWLYPALLAGHLAYGFAVWDAGIPGRTPLADWFVPVTLAMAAVGLGTSKGRDRGEGRHIADRFRSAGWGSPFYAFAGAGLLVWVIVTSPGTTISEQGARTLVLAAGTVMLGAVAWWWRERQLGSLSTLFAAAAVAALFIWKQVPAAAAEPHIALIALGFGALWWGAVDAARRFRKRFPGVAATAHFWAGPFELAGIVLGAGSLGASVLSLGMGLPGSDRAFVLCLALVGFFALEVATLEGLEVLSYMAVLMLEVAWGLWLYYDRGVHEMQFYAIPGAFYLLWVGLVQLRRHRRRLAFIMDSAGLTLMLGSSLLQSVTEALTPSTLIYGSLVAVESLGVTWWGFARRVRRFVLAGTAILIVDVMAQVFQPLLLMSRWVLTGAVGLGLVVGGLFVERKREAIARFIRQWRAQMKGWE